MAHIVSLSDASADAKLRAAYALATVIERWVPREQYLLVELDRFCASDLEARNIAVEALHTVARELDESFDWSDYESNYTTREPDHRLAILAIKVLTRPAHKPASEGPAPLAVSGGEIDASWYDA